MKRVIVIGVGNPYRRDDAIGLEIARQVSAVVRYPIAVTACDCGPTRLIETWAGFDVAIVVDAVHSGDRPGTVHRFEPGPEGLTYKAHRDSSHGIGVAEAVELAGLLHRLPERVVIIGVEGAAFTHGVGLTRGVAEAIPLAVEAVLSEIQVSLRQSA